MARQQGGERALGPYPTGDGRWRVVLVGADGRRVDSTFESEAEARGVVASTQRRIAAARRSAVTVGDTIDRYEVMMRDDKKNRKTSWAETGRRLRLFFAAHVDLPVAMLTPARCERAYEVLRTEYVSPVTERRLADDSQMNMLAEAKTFGAWLAEGKMISANPLGSVKAKGRRSHHGKAQLRVDEARRWTAKAFELADAGDNGAVAALIALLLGLRAGEITGRVVRDLDESGAVLWVPTSKTKAGVRTVEVPDDLRPYLLAQAKGKGPSAPLFAGTGGRPHWRDWVRKNVARICRLAGVPRVCAHSMRGAHASLTMARGETGHAVAVMLGHHSPSVTLASYAHPSAVAAGQAARLRQRLLPQSLPGPLPGKNAPGEEASTMP